MRKLLYWFGTIVSICCYWACERDSDYKEISNCNYYSYGVKITESVIKSQYGQNYDLIERINALDVKYGGSSFFDNSGDVFEIKEMAEEELDALLDEFKAEVENKDLGMSYFNVVCHFYISGPDKFAYDSKDYVFEYSDSKNRSFNDEVQNVVKDVEVLSSLQYAPGVRHNLTYAGSSLLPEEFDDVIIEDALEFRYYNADTFEMYKGDKFVTNVQYWKKENVFDASVKFDGNHLSDYGGHWYVLVPAKLLKDDKVKEVYLQFFMNIR